MEPQIVPKAYLNTAGCGIISKASLQTAAEIYNDFAINSSTRSELWREKEEPLYRKTLATFLGVDEQRLAFIPNFSYAMNILVQSLKGDESILLYQNDYPSITAPFIQNGFKVQWVERTDGFYLSVESVEKIFKEHTIDILAIGHVQWQTGFKTDIAALSALCKQYQVKLVVDATQSLGAIPIAMQELGIDVLIASNYKWMNSGFGNGIIYFDPSFLVQYPPVITGASSLDFKGTARSYEPGGLNIYGLALLYEALLEKMEIGIDRIYQHNMRLTKSLLDGLVTHKEKIEIVGDYTIQNRASIVVLKEISNHNGSLGAYLAKQGIIVTNRAGTLRVSMHFYNKAEEIGYFLEVIESWLK
ncbi:Selenocysteine lyase/Cysteine desulfurase [Arachidicoccus rhizosphaerae]|jgi:selenocysteine lyase/cysteine desulfurase|uniref:Selenocysteine lyase/Cysteine desulfurase n=1 Tax=Arachidicoccus rhizosphaerae TaxID=551991 RepID=A0A1H3VHR7_9BACT|nr:aminotransferase class V-fold PLP-dependent enzyme [Arachidicoccus rhizosphaerae]SDZ74315.1 Selenocysteine lyase/Cysteine desulfurase [Arachidicoccus rhizosphaerae]